MIRSTGLRAEILLTLALLLGTALLSGGFLMLRYNRNMLFQERVEQLESFSRILGPVMVKNVRNRLTSDSEGEKSFLSPTMLERLNCIGWRIYGPNLKVLTSFSTEDLSAFPSSSHQLALTTGQVQRSLPLSQPVFLIPIKTPIAQFIIPVQDTAEGIVGLLEIQYSLQDISAIVLKSQKLLVLYVCLFAAVLFVAGYLLLKKNIINPAERLLQATQDLREGRFDTSLSSVGPQEFAQIASSFNEMVYALQKSRNETETYISSLEKANSELSQARDELIRSEKMATVGQLAAGLAHEIGNPLSAIIGYLELLKASNKSEPDCEIVARSIKEASRIDFLVKELLNFSRPSPQAEYEPINLAEELHSCVELLKNQGMLADVDIVDETENMLPPIHFNKHKIKQVLVNLLLNAVHACAKGGEIRLTSGYDANQVWLAITDNGSGISSENLSKIFDPFYTTKKIGEGTGLGLAVCQRFVADGNGQILVESETGKGSCFKICFSWK